MDAIISLTISLLEAVVPNLSGANAALITKIIDGLVALVPVLVKEYKGAMPFVKNVIMILKNNNKVTPEQLQILDELETQIDADFEAAAAKVLAEDNKT